MPTVRRAGSAPTAASMQRTASAPSVAGLQRPGFAIAPRMAVAPAAAGAAAAGEGGAAAAAAPPPLIRLGKPPVPAKPLAITAGGGGKAARGKRVIRRYDSGTDSSGTDSEAAASDDEEWARLVTSGKLSKGDKLAPVDHSTMNYPPFRKNFYIEVDLGFVIGLACIYFLGF